VPCYHPCRGSEERLARAFSQIRHFRGRARMAKLADACISQVHAGNGVRVQVPLRARPHPDLTRRARTLSVHHTCEMHARQFRTATRNPRGQSAPRVSGLSRARRSTTHQSAQQSSSRSAAPRSTSFRDTASAHLRPLAGPRAHQDSRTSLARSSPRSPHRIPP
jgi:hypothetical protein